MGPAQGLPEESVINCDTVITVAKDQLSGGPVGRLDLRTTIQLDQALRYALDIGW